MNQKIAIKWEYIVPLLATASLLIACTIVSAKKFFWFDEILSYYLLNDPSFTHMMVVFGDKLTNTPPLYFILGWFWVKAFSAAELSLRLFSSLGICIACVTVWITLRRTYSFSSASIGTLGVFCVSELILVQNAEARMYCLFMAVCGLGLLQYDLLNRQSNCSRNLLLSNILIHAAIVQTHLFGLLYSGAIIFSFMVRDLYFKTFRPKIYLSAILSWLSLIPYIPVFINQADVGNPRSWLSSPTLANLTDFFGISASTLSFQTIVIILILISGLQYIYESAKAAQNYDMSQQNNQKLNAEISLLIFAYAWLAVPIFAWIVSRTIKPIFWDRYMIPSTISWAILLAYFTSRIICNNRFNFSPNFINFKLLEIAIIAILLINPVSKANSFSRQNLPGLNDGKYGYKELPIVTQSAHDFSTRFHYSPERNRYFYILDWQAALDIKSGQFATQSYKTMEALKRNYAVFQESIMNGKEFIKKHKIFLFLADINYQKCNSGRRIKDVACPRWLEMQIMSKPQYKVTDLGQIDQRKLLLVEQKKVGIKQGN